MIRALSRITLLIVLGYGAAPAVEAQEISSQVAASTYLEPEVQQRVATVDSLTQFRTELRPDGRFDLDHRVLRAEYHIRADPSPQLQTEAAARRYLRTSEAKFGISDPENQLILSAEKHGYRSSHVTFQQTYRGVPVYNREVKVNLDRDGRPTMVLNGFAPHLSSAGLLATDPSISVDEAARRAAEVGRSDLETGVPELVVYPSDPPRLAWKLIAWPQSGAVEWEVLVDAHTGEIMQIMDLSFHAHYPAFDGKYGGKMAHSAGGELNVDLSTLNDSPLSPAVIEDVVERPFAGTRIVDGTGLVFDPDPLSSAGVTYAPPYVDADDADIPELNAERRSVILRDISQGSDGLYRLEGPFVVIDDGTRGNPYAPPAESSPDAFQYTRGDAFFEAVNAYYHVDKSQRYVQSLDVGFAIKNEPVLVNPHGFDTDDSQYQAGGNIILLGTGGIDDAEDADVIWHEYAHALLDFSAPGIINTGDGSALHEGWGDYWAASYSRFLSEEDPTVSPHDWSHVFNWDGNTNCWKGRPLDHPGHYPDQVAYPTSGCASFGGSIYEAGMLWATTLMDIYPHIGRSVLDRLNLASHAYIGSGVTFPDAAHAIIQADEDLYSGAHANVLIDQFASRGYVDPSDFGPILSHEELAATEQIGGAVEIEVSAVGTTAEVDSVMVYFGDETAISDRIVLTPQGANTYRGSLPLPNEPGRLHYFIESVDEAGRRRRLPSDAPVETFGFDVGPDQVPPVIVHEPPVHISVVGWPMDVYADVSDNIGVDTVWVEYQILDVTGQPAVEGAFGLEGIGSEFFARFPVMPHEVTDGEAVSYRIFAGDASAGGNVSVAPEDGAFEVRIVEEGVLRAYNFEGHGHGLQGDGVWRRSEPNFGLRVAHSGEFVWETRDAGAYPDFTQRSTLRLPPIDVSGIESTYLVFWHWYDFEHDGAAEPGVFHSEANLWDGGNVKVSVDGGETWSVPDPEGGYNGVISERSGNPMAGEPAFGGFSYGWRQEIVPLPEAAEISIRFDFATDDDNDGQALHFAGWFIDDVSVTSVYPADADAPRLLSVPDERSVRVPGQEDTPQISVTAEDDTGIEGVFSEYTIYEGGFAESGVVRLAMAETDADIYHGGVVPPQSFSAGDRIEYRLRVRDFAGNEAVYPGSDDLFVVDYRAVQRSSALSGVVSTGAWHVQGGTWLTSDAEARASPSSLVLAPVTLPSNSESATLIVEHRYELPESTGGNLKISTDDGGTWALATPKGGYPESFGATDHSMAGEGVFAGSSAGAEIAAFDLSPYAGERIRIRFDFAHTGLVAAGSGWFIDAAVYESLSPDDEFETPFELELHANFPDPFADRTTISYSISDRGPVRLSVFDMLGRRVALIRHVIQDAGIYTVQYDGSHLSSGVYLLHLETSEGNRTERMIVAR